MDKINRFLEAFLRRSKLLFRFLITISKDKTARNWCLVHFVKWVLYFGLNARYRATAIRLVCYPSIILNLGHRQASMIVNAPVLNFPLFKYLSSPGHLTKKSRFSIAYAERHEHCFLLNVFLLQCNDSCKLNVNNVAHGPFVITTYFH